MFSFHIVDGVTPLLQWSLYCLQELTNFATLTAFKYSKMLVNQKHASYIWNFPCLCSAAVYVLLKITEIVPFVSQAQARFLTGSYSKMPFLEQCQLQ